jgi:ankyrin repeat protein
MKTNDGMTPFLLAVLGGHTNTARVLLGHNGELLNMPCDDGYYPIHIATINIHLETLKLLVEKDKEVVL